MKRITFSFKIAFLVVFSTLFCINGYSQKTREEITDKYKWDLTDNLTPIGAQPKMPLH
jgi:hypothetical protein